MTVSVGHFKSDLQLFDHAEISSQIIYVFLCFHNSKKNTSALLLKSTMNFSEFLSKGMICDFFFYFGLKYLRKPFFLHVAVGLCLHLSPTQGLFESGKECCASLMSLLFFCRFG